MLLSALRVLDIYHWRDVSGGGGVWGQMGMGSLSQGVQSENTLVAFLGSGKLRCEEHGRTVVCVQVPPA